jgi:hypothetical protein
VTIGIHRAECKAIEPQLDRQQILFPLVQSGTFLAHSASGNVTRAKTFWQIADVGSRIPERHGGRA